MAGGDPVTVSGSVTPTEVLVERDAMQLINSDCLRLLSAWFIPDAEAPPPPLLCRILETSSTNGKDSLGSWTFWLLDQVLRSIFKDLEKGFWEGSLKGFLRIFEDPYGDAGWIPQRCATETINKWSRWSQLVTNYTTQSREDTNRLMKPHRDTETPTTPTTPANHNASAGW